MNNKQIILITLLFLVALPSINADPQVCCERLQTGQWCQDAPKSECNADYSFKITSCEETAMCQTGTCWNNYEGTCEAGVSQRVCNDAKGVWSEKDPEDLPQCKIGCCANTGNIVTQTRCAQLSQDYGVEIDFRLDIKTDFECRFIKLGDEKGACILETESRRTCQLLTREECDAQDNDGFHAGYLCSDHTIVQVDCGPSKETTCVDDDDAVYFVDTCGNLANVYDSARQNDVTYWSKIIPKQDSCGWNDEKGNTNSQTCGNCDSYAQTGSTCGEYKRGETAVPKFGDNICKDMGCLYDTFNNGKPIYYGQGDAWCAVLDGVDVIKQEDEFGKYKPNQDYRKVNLPGTTYGVLKCFDGEVTTEYCSEGRQDICVESEFNGYRNAVCKPNLWGDCYDQINQERCEDREARDCFWVDGMGSNRAKSKYNIPRLLSGIEHLESGDGNSQNLMTFIKKESVEEEDRSNWKFGYCVPMFTPGFDFWAGEGNGEGFCAMGTSICEYEITTGLLKDNELEKGKLCVDEKGNVKKGWVNLAAQKCGLIGDCGPKTNYQGDEGSIEQLVKKIISMKDGRNKDGETKYVTSFI